MKKKNFRFAAILIALIMVVGVFAACNNAGTTTSTAGSEGSSASAAANDETVYELSLSTHDPATSNKTKFHEEWARRVTEASNGRLKVTVFPGATLAPATSALDALRNGTVDIAWIYPPYFTGQFPKSEVLSLPLGFDSVPQATNTLWDLYESESALQAELSEYVPIMMHSNPVNKIATIENKPVSKLSDIKSLKFRAAGGVASDLVQAWGATPMQMSPGDIFQAIEKGTIDGYVFDYSGIQSFSLQDVTANFTDYAVYLGPYYLLMNKEKFESLPADLQQIILNNSTRETSLEMAYIYEGDERNGLNTILEAGGKLIEVSDTDKALFTEAGQTVLKTWITSNDTTDFDAQAYVDKARELATKYHIDKDALNKALDEKGL